MLDTLGRRIMLDMCMSCTIDQILDPATQRQIDKGVDRLSQRIATASSSRTCTAFRVDRTVALVDILIQCVILAFVVFALFQHEHSALIVKVIEWTAYVSLALLVIRYRNAIISSVRLLSALDVGSKVVIFLSVAAAIATEYIKKGQAGMRMTLVIAMVLFVKVSLQMREFLNEQNSTIPVFLTFVKDVFTPHRIDAIFSSIRHTA